VQLGPGMCLARVPHCGRNFEYISGEDPVLGASMVGPLVTGIQAQGVIAVSAAAGSSRLAMMFNPSI